MEKIMKFLIQKELDYFEYDFCHELFNAIQYQKWLGNEIKYNIDELKFISCYDNNYIPCGSVEFVSTYMNQIGLFVPKPRNVPESLFEYAGRKIRNIQEDFIGDNYYNYYFVKSNDIIKGISGISIDLRGNVIPKGWYQISDQVGILSEYRCFVYKQELVGIQNYQGDFTVFPNILKIKKMINNFSNQPITYTLDIFIDCNLDTWCLEVHDFFSCGLYGFRDYKILPLMFSNWWNEYKKRNKVICQNI